MTIDEFKKDIAPHMNKGFVAMDKDNMYWLIKTGTMNESCFLGKMFSIEPVEDWTKSLIEVGQ